MGVDIDALVAGARAQFDKTEPVDQDVLLGDEVVTLRVRPVEAHVWRGLLAEHAPRDGSVADKARGYDLTAVALVYPRIALLEGDVETDLGDKWAEIAPVLSGDDLGYVEAAVWGVNEYLPRQRLGKALAGES